jgi:asparagine synthase (glutamine-hydrolysing)
VALDLVEQLPDLLDEPLGDASILPTYLLSRFTRQGVTVALSGDGGDEFVRGYSDLPGAPHGARLSPRSGLAARGLDPPRGREASGIARRLESGLSPEAFRGGGSVRSDRAPRRPGWLSFTPEEQADLFSADALDRMQVAPSFTAFREILAQRPAQSELEQIAYLDLKGYLGEGVLTKVDRASMACSLEVRPPLLDRRMVEFAAALPMNLKLRGFTTKWILKETLRSLLPPASSTARRRDSGVPMGRWLREDLRGLLLDVFRPEALRAEGLFRPEAIARIVDEHQRGRRDHRKKLYTLLAYQLWARRYRPS